MTSQEPKTKSKKSQKSPGETCWCSSPPKRYKCWSVTGGAFLFETLVLQSLRTSPFYWRLRGRGSFKFGKFFKSFAGTALFLGSVLTVYQTATSKIITYLSWGEGLLLCSGIIFRGKLGWKSKCTLWWSVTGLKIKLLSFLFHVVSDLLRFHVSETLSWSTIFWRTFEG